MSERTLRKWKAVLGVIVAALTVVLKALELAGKIPVGWLAGMRLGAAEAVVLAYLLGYILFDIDDSFRYASQGWLIAQVLSVAALAVWAFALLRRSEFALGFLACYSAHDGLDAAYYGWCDKTFGPYPGWPWVIVSAILAVVGVAALAWSWGAAAA
jgi:hypothetical protein